MIELLQVRMIAKPAVAVMFLIDNAQELYEAEWVDDLERGFGRNGEGPDIRGRIDRGENVPPQLVYPGDVILKWDSGRREGYHPQLFASMFETMGAQVMKEDMGGHIATQTPDPTVVVGEPDPGPSGESADRADVGERAEPAVAQPADGPEVHVLDEPDAPTEIRRGPRSVATGPEQTERSNDQDNHGGRMDMAPGPGERDDMAELDDGGDEDEEEFDDEEDDEDDGEL